MQVVKIPKRGIGKIIEEIEGLFLNSPHFKNRMYQIWLGLSERDRQAIRRDIRKIIQENLLSKELWEALSKDIITKEGIQTDTYVYRYLKKYLFKGDVRRMFILLKDVRDNL